MSETSKHEQDKQQPKEAQHAVGVLERDRDATGLRSQSAEGLTRGPRQSVSACGRPHECV